MRLTVDATSMLVRSAGVKNYLWHWLRSLRRAAGTRIDLRLFPYLNDIGTLDHELSALSRAQTVARYALIKSMNEINLPRLDWVIGETDVFHGTNLLRRAPSSSRVKLTATIHDMTCWLMPELHTHGNIVADRQFADRILKHADGIIAVSENTRQDTIRLLNLPPDRIRTIHSGIAEAYFDAKPTHRGRPYVLYVGTIEPRKNLDTLLDAWSMLKPDLQEKFELVIAGPEGWGSPGTMERVRRETTYLGYVAEADLPGLIAGATAFAYPSLYEGFGFPVVQAMAARVPVLTSNTSCLPEIAGDAAVLVDPKSVAEIAAGLTRLLESESLRSELSARGRARAQQFQWEKCATESIEFFEHVLGR